MSKLPKSKKATYYAIKEKVFKNGEPSKGLYSIVGPRRIGKTILMRQLCEEFNGLYLSIEDLGGSYNGTVEDSNKLMSAILEALDSEYRLICIDEITQMPKFKYGKLAHELKLAWDKTVFITGSIPKAVKDFGISAGVNCTFSMSSLTYWEYCNWYEQSINFNSYTNYLSYKQFEEIDDIKEYATLTLGGSINSFRADCTKISDMEESMTEILRDNRFNDYLSLICLSGQFKLSYNSKFEDLPSLVSLEAEDRQEDYANLKSIRLTNKHKIEALELFLTYTGLGRYCNQYEYTEKDKPQDWPILNAAITSKFVGFEFPCFGSAVFNELVTGEGFDFNHQCEVDVFNLASKLFYDAGKFRNSNTEELDFVSRSFALEVKNANYKQGSKHLGDYLKIVERLKIPNLLLTTSTNVLELTEMGETKVIRAYLPLVAYTLGELFTTYKPDRSLEWKALEIIYPKLLKNKELIKEEDSKR